MDLKGKLLYSIGYVVVLTVIVSIIVFVRGVDLSKPLMEEKVGNCNIELSNNSVVVTEGQNFTIKAKVSSLEKGTHEISMRSNPVFVRYPGELNITMDTKSTSFDIELLNATPGEDSQLSWNKINLKITGASKCESQFSIRVIDNCVTVYNPDQTDVDEDGIGDACDTQICGNGICETGENHTNCCADCGCLPGQTCVNNFCEGEAFACVWDTDCDDGVPCTRDVCYHRNTSNAVCGHLELTRCSEEEHDGCCPEGCHGNNDIDCEAECGNGICEDFFGKESFRNCSRDCEREDD